MIRSLAKAADGTAGGELGAAAGRGGTRGGRSSASRPAPLRWASRPAGVRPPRVAPRLSPGTGAPPGADYTQRQLPDPQRPL